MYRIYPMRMAAAARNETNFIFEYADPGHAYRIMLALWSAGSPTDGGLNGVAGLVLADEDALHQAFQVVPCGSSGGDEG